MLLGIGVELDNQSPCCSNKIKQNFKIEKHKSEIHMSMLYLKNRTTSLPITVTISKYGFKVAYTKTYGNAVVEELNS